jgi:hypothetical protein
MNRQWIKSLMAFSRWTQRRIRAAIRREKVRWFKRQLQRKDLWKN